ncbi:MAG: putative RNA uridine N3 methyltransferase [Candidatus Nanohaloarchaea archaeon]
MQVIVPSTFGTDERDDKLKVYKFGRLARAVSIFGVDRVTIYRDEDPKADEERNSELLEKHLEYAETPPYLRKKLIPKDPDLSNASILPALQILSHGYSDRFREAVVEESGEGGSVLDAGLDHDVEVGEELPEGERVTLRILDGDGAEVIDRESIEGFWTFDVQNDRRELGEVLDEVEAPVVGTSRHGEPLQEFASSRFVDEDVALVFGSAWRGIPDLVERGDVTEEQFAGVFNFVPGQQTKTVRTAEAVPIVLGVLNALRRL